MTPPSAEELDHNERLAIAYCEMVQTGSAALAEHIFSDHLEFWQNTTRKTLYRDEMIARTLALHTIPEFRYENIEREVFRSGYVQRHDACGAIGGAKFRVPVCIVADVRGGKITRVCEYLDSAQDPRKRPLI